MNEIIISLVGYLAGDLITLILSRFGVINLAPVIKPVIKELISLVLDPKTGKVGVVEKNGTKKIIRDPSEDDWKIINKISQNLR